MAEGGAAAEPGISQHAGKAQTGLPHPVDLGQRNLTVRAASGTPAASQRSASSVQAAGRTSRSPTGSGTAPRAKVSETCT